MVVNRLFGCTVVLGHIPCIVVKIIQDVRTLRRRLGTTFVAVHPPVPAWVAGRRHRASNGGPDVRASGPDV